MLASELSWFQSLTVRCETDFLPVLSFISRKQTSDSAFFKFMGLFSEHFLKSSDKCSNARLFIVFYRLV